MSGIWLFLSNMLCYTWGFIVARYSKGKEIKELIKEKEDLQKRFNNLLEAHKICDEQNMDHATRIDKAIEYIQNRIEDINNGGNEHDYRNLNEILNILQGSDTNE